MRMILFGTILLGSAAIPYRSNRGQCTPQLMSPVGSAEREKFRSQNADTLSTTGYLPVLHFDRALSDIPSWCCRTHRSQLHVKTSKLSPSAVHTHRTSSIM